MKIRPNVVLLLLSGLSKESICIHKVSENNIEWMNLERKLKNVDMDARGYTLETQIPTSSLSNWITLFTGANVEIHGVYGDSKNVKTPGIDSIFQRIYDKAEYINTESIGSDFFEKSISSSLTHFNARRKIVPLSNPERSFEEFKKYKSQKFDAFINRMVYLDNVNDEKERAYNSTLTRIKDLQEKISSSSDPSQVESELSELQKIVGNRTLLNSVLKQYYFLVLQDDEIQATAAGSGLGSETDDSISTKVKKIETLISKMSKDTVLLVTSDHGTVKPGGNGGFEDETFRVPLLVYKKGSGFGKSRYATTVKPQTHPIQNLGPTISGLLGLPIPRHNQGQFINEVMMIVFETEDETKLSYLDLRNQRVQFMKSFISGEYFHLANHILDQKFENFLYTNYKPLNETTKEYYALETEYVNANYDKVANEIKTHNYMTLSAINTVFLLLVFLVILFVVHRFTNVDYMTLFSVNDNSISRHLNLISFFSALKIFSSFLFSSVTIFIVYFFAIRGYKVWSMSIIPTPSNLTEFFLVSFFIQLLLGGVYTRFPFWVVARWKRRNYFVSFFSQYLYDDAERVNPDDDKTTLVKYMSFKHLFSSLDKIDIPELGLAYVYLIRFYFLIICSFVFVILLIMSTAFRDPIFLRSTSLIDYSLWNHRFRILNMMLLVLPYFITGILALYTWPAWTSTRRVFDSIYLLKELKMERYTVEAGKPFLSSFSLLLNSDFSKVSMNFDSVACQKKLIALIIQSDKKGLKSMLTNCSKHFAFDETIRKEFAKFMLNHKFSPKISSELHAYMRSFGDENQLLHRAIYRRVADVYNKYEKELLSSERERLIEEESKDAKKKSLKEAKKKK